MIKKIPAMIKVNPNRMWPFGFHASLRIISEGPTVSLPNAFANEARNAALEVLWLIPPEPRRNPAPARINNIPSKAEISGGW